MKTTHLDMTLRGLARDVEDATRDAKSAIETLIREALQMNERLDLGENVYSNGIESYAAAAVREIGDLRKAREIQEKCERVVEAISNDEKRAKIEAGGVA